MANTSFSEASILRRLNALRHSELARKQKEQLNCHEENLYSYVASQYSLTTAENTHVTVTEVFCLS